MIDKNYFSEIGLGDYTDKYAQDELAETTVAIRLPKTVLEKIQLAMDWRSLSFQQHVERELFVQAISQADNLSKLLEARREAPQVSGDKV